MFERKLKGRAEGGGSVMVGAMPSPFSSEQLTTLPRFADRASTIAYYCCSCCYSCTMLAKAVISALTAASILCAPFAELNPTLRSITYDIGDLYSYIDQMPDLSALVFDPQLQAYIPYGKDW